MPPLTEYRSPYFDRKLKEIKKLFPKAEIELDELLKTISKNPAKGALYSGLNLEGVRKIRGGLRAYRLGKRGGIRVIIQHANNSEWLLFLTIYPKKKNLKEDAIKKMILTSYSEFTALLDEEDSSTQHHSE
jgi:mRNA-degrading endonuclease RelE of RelBE toxin-antitoxin system